ncbi:twin-arginine translocase TatA/TatE family subunit [Rubrobacter taiwanensis]|jgi:Sec-independent protein translocase protein TatA|uniref:Twin-arginine translocase TatA/TatE family subunit n=1 Tax=Rubrobacter taiwanensis TaxID=185139 RepID=A0A4R1BM01_9ACTN|nr:twin-arginine translocase TatA/TatE family subunit [Rubrobacter taiwanensis]TCJ18429.1 twin-arginine translocase TatA/TatE family subunit [Rubrobacter taiwanensis]
MLGLGPFELLILLFVVFLILGPRRISALAGSLKRGVRDFAAEFEKRGDRSRLEDGEGEDPDRGA